MMKSRKKFAPLYLLLILLFLLFVLYSDLVMKGAKNGVELCLSVVLPSLFPFFVLSQLFVELGLFSLLPGRQGWLLPLVLGLVSGYPVGSRCVANLYENGEIGRDQASYYLSFCSNSGPAFIIGAVGVGMMGDLRAGGLLYVCHILSALACGLLLYPFVGRKKRGGPAPKKSTAPASLLPAFLKSVKDSFATILNVCAFIIFFAVLIELCRSLGLFSVLAAALCRVVTGLPPAGAEALFSGLLEFTSGTQLAVSGCSMAAALPLCAFLIGFGGLSIHFQVLSILERGKLPASLYFIGKSLQALLSVVILYPLLRLSAALPAFLSLSDLPDLPASRFFLLLLSGGLILFSLTLFAVLLFRIFFPKKRFPF